MNKEFYITLGGGLGDVLWRYHCARNSGWLHIASLKEKFPNVKIKALCSTNNPQTLELLKFNPYIDEKQDFGWVQNGSELWEKHKGNAMFLQTAPIKKKLKVKPNRVFLSPEEHQFCKNIKNQKDYIVIHPFAGEDSRIGFPEQEYPKLIDRIIDELGLNVVVIGQNYKRTYYEGFSPKEERIDHQRDGLFNLTLNNSMNVRIACDLIRYSKHFVGSWSAYACLSWVYDKTTSIIIPQKASAKLEFHAQAGRRWHNKKIDYIKTRYSKENQAHDNFDQIADKVIKSIDKV